MGHQGAEFYDDGAVFDTYWQGRRRLDGPNDTLERPVLMELAGDLRDKRILDLGCGNASLGREAFAAGCRSYQGVDGSANMIAAARTTLAGTAGVLVYAHVETWDYPVAAFDLVVSGLVMHYVEHVEPVFARVQQALVPGGRFVFSVEHPVITSCDRSRETGGPRQDWIVDDYFDTGQRVTSWLGSRVVKYHRTVEDYFLALQRAGFVVESVRESRPQRAHFESEAVFVRRKRIPLFLFLAGARVGPP